MINNLIKALVSIGASAVNAEKAFKSFGKAFPEINEEEREKCKKNKKT